MNNKLIPFFTLSLAFVSGVSVAAVPEARMADYESKVSMSKSKQEKLIKLGDSVYSSSSDKLYSSKYWGKFGTFSKVGVEVQGSLAYGMALDKSSDLDIAFVYKYNSGSSMAKLNPVELKKDAVSAFKEVFGNRFNYTIKDPVVNLSNKNEDIDVAFFNVLNKSTVLCGVAKKCSELNYGKDPATAGWYLSERLSLYSEFDNVFSKNTKKREMVNRTGKFFKLWRENTFPGDVAKIPSIALVTMIYDFSKEKGSAYPFLKSTDTLRDVTGYSIAKYFKNNKCEGAATAEINLPVYQKDRNLLGKLTVPQRINTCKKLVEFNKALAIATSSDVSEAESVKMLEPFIGKF